MLYKSSLQKWIPTVTLGVRCSFNIFTKTF